MKRLSIVLAFFWSGIIAAQQVSTFPQQPMTEFFAFDVAGNNIVALGTCDQIWWSIDEGASWEYQELSGFYRDVVYSPTNPNEVIFRQNTALTVYNLQTEELTPITDPLISNFGNAPGFHTVGSDLYIFNRAGISKANTSDWEWTNVYEWTDVGNDYPTATAHSGDYLFMGTHLGKIYAFNHMNGEMSLVAELLNEIKEIAMGSEMIGYAKVDGQSQILATDDQWNTFNPALGLAENIQPIAFGENVITLNTNRIYRSTDKGATAEYIEMRGPYNGLSATGKFTDDGVLYIVGGASMVLKSTDFGLTFENLNRLFRGNLYDASVRADGTGYAVGNAGFVLKTTDMGQTWSFTDIAAGEEDLYDCIYTTDGALMISDGRKLYTFQDEQLLRTEDFFVNDLIYIESDNSILMSRTIGGANEIIKSTDAGASWSPVLPLGSAAYSIQESYDGRLFITTGTTEVHQSRDNGNTWETVDFGLPDLRIVQFYNEDIGLFVGSRKMFKSTNGGASKLEVADQYAINDVHWISEDHYVYQSRQNFITNLWESTDGGASKMKTFESCSLSNKIIRLPDGDLLTLQRGGHMNKIVVQEETSTADRIVKIDEQFLVYPNPVVAGQTVSWDEKYHSVQILALDGSKVYQCATQNNEIEIPASLPTGMYFMQAQLGDQVKTTKVFVR